MLKTKKIFLLFLFALLLLEVQSQSELNRTVNWRFGHKAGITFDKLNNYQQSVFNGSKGIVKEGNSCISDTNGNLLFYCTGDTVWNALHQPMLNGTGMPSDKITLLNSVIIPRPGNSNQYYIFINQCVNNNPTGGKLKYSLVDMTLDGGKGAVVAGQKNIIIMQQAYNSAIAYTKHANGIDYWMAYGEPNSPYNICMIKVTNAGPDTINRVISSFGVGVMSRFSPDGTMFADAGTYRIFQFNSTSGVLSNKIQMPTDSFCCYSPFSLEFSPNNKFIYFGLYFGGNGRSLFQQFNLSVYTQTAIAGSVYSFFDSPTYNSFRGLGHMQLGPDGKIYVAKPDNGGDSLHIIHNPNGSGVACNFQYNALALGAQSNFSLPIYPDYYFNNITVQGINEESLSENFILYPNPASNYLNFASPKNQVYDIKIYNTLGQIVINLSSSNNQKIDVSQLQEGLYTFVLSYKNGSASKKLIINH